ncbi:hypothetical protein CHS0354_000417 [Potamilus streckersoni]|uniref:DUF4115 domain-containing protein n=1 Tax=Potamilus streckersoni TaxID=2493646 RepID=A0AAE0T7G8_9BIVA|nr:hypothetical protein CHS0354_000417 [Potamilus streckersoni]
MELGDYDFLPRMYVYLILKKYASFLGISHEDVERVRHEIGVKLDEEPVFDFNELAQEEQATEKSSDELPKVSSEERRFHGLHVEKATDFGANKNWVLHNSMILIASFVAVALFFLIFLFKYLTENDSVNELNINELELKEEGQVINNAAMYQQPQALGTTTENPVLGRSEQVEKKLRIRTKNDSVWVLLIYDNKRDEMILLPKTQKSVSFKGEMRFSIGRVESVIVQLDDAILELPKRYGVLKDYLVPSTTTTNSP